LEIINKQIKPGYAVITSELAGRINK